MPIHPIPGTGVPGMYSCASSPPLALAKNVVLGRALASHLIYSSSADCSLDARAKPEREIFPEFGNQAGPCSEPSWSGRIPNYEGILTLKEVHLRP